MAYRKIWTKDEAKARGRLDRQMFTIPRGTVGGSLSGQTPEFLSWLNKQRAFNTTLADTLVSIAVDTYLDEREKEQDK